MKCRWDERRAVAIWTTHRQLDILLCAVCLNDWTLRAGQSEEVAAVLGYRQLTPLSRPRKDA